MPRANHDPWKLVYTTWDPAEEPLREALCALGNGYFVSRGAAEEARPGGAHYPGTYLHGGYNRLESHVAGRVVVNEDLVNWPSWLALTFRVEGGTWLDLEQVTLLEFRQQLDVRRGILERRMRFRDSQERETLLISRRLVHMQQPHIGAIEWMLVPQNWSGVVEIRSGLDGDIRNQGVARYSGLSCRHLETIDTGRIGEDAIFLTVRTTQSRVLMCQAARTRIFEESGVAAGERRLVEEDSCIAHIIRAECWRDKPLRVEKVVSLYTSRDVAISEPQENAQRAIRRAEPFAALLRTHERAWASLWSRADIELLGDTDPHTQLILRLHIFHLLQTTSLNTIDHDVGVPARGLHGEAYRGHVFWDELYIFPFLQLRFPELTRSLLLYRFRRLGEARHAAREAGYTGAMYPWQSGSDGREETPALHLNPRSGRWLPENTHRQRHVNAAIAYNVWEYFEATGDMEFLSFHGVEMLTSIARFFASRACYNPERGRYELRGVVGPDEYHTHDPLTGEPGLRNNAYTNIMAVWCIKRARAALELLAEEPRAELLARLEVTREELDRWDDVARRMFVPLRDGLILQFEGWETLKEVDWDGLRARHGDIHRLDRVLEAEGDDVNRYQAVKQADVLMLFFLFSREELEELFAGMGYPFDPDMIPRNVEYYLNRTSHGSTLSRVVHAWVLARSTRQSSWPVFEDALRSDVGDIQRGTTPEGIHLGAMAGTVDIVQRCYTGVEVREGVLWLNPRLPDELGGLRCRLRYRGHWLSLVVDHRQLTVRFDRGWSPSVQVGFAGEVHTMAQGEERTFPLPLG